MKLSDSSRTLLLWKREFCIHFILLKSLIKGVNCNKYNLQTQFTTTKVYNNNTTNDTWGRVIKYYSRVINDMVTTETILKPKGPHTHTWGKYTHRYMI